MAPPMAQVAFIGLGKMGLPMAARLLQAAHRVHAFNRSRTPVDALVKQGAEAAGSAAEAAARAEFVLTPLPTSESVERVYDELAISPRHGQLYAAHSPVTRAGRRRRAR